MNEVKYKNLSDKEKIIRNKIKYYQQNYNSLINSLGQLNSDLNVLKKTKTKYTFLNELKKNKIKNILSITAICLILFLLQNLMVITISLVILISNLVINLLQIKSLNKQIKNIDIEVITNQMVEKEKSIDKKREEIKTSYNKIDELQKILVCINEQVVEEKIVKEKKVEKKYVKKYDINI